MSTKRPSPTFIKMSPLDQSTLTGLAHREPTQYLRVTKMAIRQYMQECLGQDGQFRTFFNKVAPNTFGLHVNKELDSDPNKRHLQIAAYYTEARARPPQIFIQDSGYNYVTDSLGSLNAGWNMRTRDGEQTVRVMDVVRIPIEITCAALSQQEVEDLIAFMSMAFGQLQRFTINYVLRPHTVQSGVYWEVRIPLQHSISAKSHQPVHGGDPRVQLWQVTCSMEVEFENSIYLQYRSQPQLTPQRGTLSLQVPEYLRLGQEHRVVLRNRPEPVAVYSDDSRIAVVIQQNREWVISPRRVGTFNLIVSKTVGNQQGPEVLTTQQIEVRTR